ncbi:hypothetical protein KsCSTR_33660 [Candidatus Kuenenia stuttgartiensis]|uniref:Uncharacterized protein n=1 Tax=Kuenenia stuttgartiensis TaxID=174633 RepID=A0A6G7GTB0_KUEST|nr:hypothetical protein KsCSTR_33660 [Candidatus Kuenenia stuttgartiensis]
MRLETDFIKLPVASTFQFLIGAMRPVIRGLFLLIDRFNSL